MLPIVISMSDEAAELLVNNQVNLLQELRKQGIEIERAPERPAGAPPAEPGMKGGPELIIMTSGGAAVLVGAAISQIISSVSKLKNPPKIHKRAWEPVVDKDGNIVKDGNGQPMMKWSELDETPIEERSTKISFLTFQVDISENKNN